MRQHVLRSKEKINEENKEYIVPDAKSQKGKWRELFLSKNPDALFMPLYIEIGSGKGQFMMGQALAHPDRLYLACEGAINIYPRILQKAGAAEVPNLLVITEYIIEPSDYFEKGELNGVYLNFSDPWPKDRHAHRRLTHEKKLRQYKEIMSPGTTLEFKTDNDTLFEFSVEQVSLAGLTAAVVERDLHSSVYAKDNIMTEYEEKFSGMGKSINYLRIEF